MKKIAIIGASYLQVPLIKKAKEMGLETHVFAWQVGDEGETLADFFYPISIVEKEEILEKCREIGIDGIVSIASDLAAITVNYVANRMGLVGNTDACTLVSTNKHAMRECFEKNGDPSPRSVYVSSDEDLLKLNLKYPLIVKPVDRSGSRGITLVEDESEMQKAFDYAKEQGFEKAAVVEEYATGEEFSVECISWKGKHTFLALTKKYTTGAPSFIETGHMEPAEVSSEDVEKIVKVVFHALDSLGVSFGASHSEVKLGEDGVVRIIEIGARMGGDNIGSSLVKLTTGVDFVKAVIEIAMGSEPEIKVQRCGKASIKYIFTSSDLEEYRQLLKECPEKIVEAEIDENATGPITDSSNRYGYYILHEEE